MITGLQIKKIHALLPEEVKNDNDLKESIIVEFTGDVNKKSTKDLTFYQANLLIERFGGKPVHDKWAGFDFQKESHRKILSLLQQAGWVRYDKNLKRHVADMPRFAQWLKGNKSPVQKPLKTQTSQEVSKTIIALTGVLNYEIQNIKR